MFWGAGEPWVNAPVGEYIVLRVVGWWEFTVKYGKPYAHIPVWAVHVGVGGGGMCDRVLKFVA